MPSKSKANLGMGRMVGKADYTCRLWWAPVSFNGHPFAHPWRGSNDDGPSHEHVPLCSQNSDVHQHGESRRLFCHGLCQTLTVPTWAPVLDSHMAGAADDQGSCGGAPPSTWPTRAFLPAPL